MSQEINVSHQVLVRHASYSQKLSLLSKTIRVRRRLNLTRGTARQAWHTIESVSR